MMAERAPERKHKFQVTRVQGAQCGSFVVCLCVQPVLRIGRMVHGGASYLSQTVYEHAYFINRRGCTAKMEKSC